MPLHPFGADAQAERAKPVTRYHLKNGIAFMLYVHLMCVSACRNVLDAETIPQLGTVGGFPLRVRARSAGEQDYELE